MKKFVVAVATVFAVAAVVAGGVAASDSGPKLIDSGFACGILDGNGNVFITTNSSRWLSQNKVWIQCEGNGAPAKVLTYFNFGNTGLTCNIGGGYGGTRDWVDKVGRAGNSQLTCKLSIDDPAASSSGGAGLG